MTLPQSVAAILSSPVDATIADPLQGAAESTNLSNGRLLSPLDSEAEGERLLHNGNIGVGTDDQTPVHAPVVQMIANGHSSATSHASKFDCNHVASDAMATSRARDVSDLEHAELHSDHERDTGIQIRTYGGFSFNHSDDDSGTGFSAANVSKSKSSIWSQTKRRAASCCSREAFVDLLNRRFPILQWSRRYTMNKFYSDLIAGMTVGLTVIPQGLAYAAIANLPLQYGLYTAYMGCFVYMFLGTAKDLNLGPTAIVSLMTAQYLFEITDDDERVKHAVLLTFVCGVIQLVLAVLQLGFLTRFISHPVIAGFSSAAALIIALSQLDSLLGYSINSREFLPSLWETFAKLGQFRWPDFLLGIICVVLLTFLKRLGDKVAAQTTKPTSRAQENKRTVIRYVSISRNAIIAVVASLIAAFVDKQWPGALSLTKDVKAGIPAPQFPTFVLGDDQNVFQTLRRFGVGLALVPLISLVEALAIGKAFGNKNGYHIDSTQEFFALGAANVIASCFHSYPVTGSFSRSALSSQSHVQTPAGNLWTSMLVVLALAVLSPLFYYVPKAGLSAIIICAVLPMIEWHEVKLLWRLRRVDLLPLFATLLGSLCLGIELGLAAGVGVSLLLLLYAVSRPQVKVVSWLQHNLVLIKPQAALYFPSGEYLQSVVQETIESITARRRATETSQRKVTAAAFGERNYDAVRLLLDASHVVDLDSSAMQSIKMIEDMVAQESAIELYFVNLSDEAKRLLTIAGCKQLRVYEAFLADVQGRRLAAAEVIASAATEPVSGAEECLPGTESNHVQQFDAVGNPRNGIVEIEAKQ